MSIFLVLLHILLRVSRSMCLIEHTHCTANCRASLFVHNAWFFCCSLSMLWLVKQHRGELFVDDVSNLKGISHQTHTLHYCRATSCKASLCIFLCLLMQRLQLELLRSSVLNFTCLTNDFLIIICIWMHRRRLWSTAEFLLQASICNIILTWCIMC